MGSPGRLRYHRDVQPAHIPEDTQMPDIDNDTEEVHDDDFANFGADLRRMVILMAIAITATAAGIWWTGAFIGDVRGLRADPAEIKADLRDLGDTPAPRPGSR
jgi:hypothetical protein